ncbi:hypothetical protein ES703_27608 [subsurface metagenome]
MTSTATIKIIPILAGSKDKGYGSAITWDSRLFAKGRMGPAEVDVPSLMGVGLSLEDAEDWAARTADAVLKLGQLYPAITPEIEARIEEVRKALPEAVKRGAEVRERAVT